MDRYTPRGVWADKYTDQQRSDIISQILGDAFYLEHLSKGIRHNLRSEEPARQIEGLISVHKFEDRIAFFGGREAFELSKRHPAQITEAEDRIAEILGDRFYLKHLYPSTLDLLRSDNAERQADGLEGVAKLDGYVKKLGGREAYEQSKLTSEQRQVIQARREAEAEETATREAAQRMLGLSNLPEDIAAKLRSPKYKTVQKGVRLGKEWLAAKQAEREAAQAIIDQQQLVETLAPLLEQAEQLYSDIESLLKQQDLTTERRQKLQELLDTNEDHCDNPIRLTHWIDKAQTEIGRTTRKLAKSTVPEPTDPPQRRVDWKAIDAKRMPDVGKPNVQAVGTVTRGVAVAGAGMGHKEKSQKKR